MLTETKNKILIISPHPDDETLGCGGTILKHKDKGDEINWLIVTKMFEKHGWKKKEIFLRKKEIKNVSKQYKFKKVFELNLPASRLDEINISKIIKKFVDIIKLSRPNTIYLPFSSDVHTDHQITYKAAKSCLKWFRHPYIKNALMYETVSETNFNFSTKNFFNPNRFIDITNQFEKKIKIMQLYKSEIKNHPFPRSKESIKAISLLRGSQSGYKFAEAFQTIFDRSDLK